MLTSRLIHYILMESLQIEDSLLGTLLSVKEVLGAVKKMKDKKAAGPDGMNTEHIKEGGAEVVIWLTGILNGIIEIEAILSVLKCMTVVPFYKGGGKDPLRVDSYQGIT